MILGTGIDIVDLERFRRSIDRYGKHFLDHVFSADEQSRAPVSDIGRLNYYAGRWAAKEAVAKVLGTGICAQCAWTDIILCNRQDGKPVVKLHGNGAETARALGIVNIHVSISHERNYACAIAIGESM